MPCNVLIVDDQNLPQRMMEHIVSDCERYKVVDCLNTARVADSYCARGLVDLILMDVVMSDGFNGLEAAARIKASYPQVKIIVVTSMPDSHFIALARQAGVDSFWYKEVQKVPLLELMDRTMSGEHIFPDEVPSVKLGFAHSEDLTEREKEVLALLAEGLTDREIAEKLYLSATTVRYHVNNMLNKTGYSSRTALAVNAVLSGIIVPGI